MACAHRRRRLMRCGPERAGGGVHRDLRDPAPRFLEHQRRSLRVPAQVELLPRVAAILLCKVVVGRHRVEAAAHEEQSVGQLCKLWVKTRGERQIRRLKW